MIRVTILILSFLFLGLSLNASENKTEKLPKYEWSFDGLTGTYDRSSLQRGYKVYREVCAGCHSMNLLYFRDLLDIGFTEEQIKVIASEYIVIDGPIDQGEKCER